MLISTRFLLPAVSFQVHDCQIIIPQKMIMYVYLVITHDIDYNGLVVSKRNSFTTCLIVSSIWEI